MYAKDLACDDGSDGKGVENIDERLPRLDICAPLAFIVKPVYYGAGQPELGQGDMGTYLW